MIAIKAFEARFRELLDQLDAIVEEVGDEDLEELNAEFEDALFMLHEIDPKSEDAAGEFDDALEEFEALKEDYARWPEAREAAKQLGVLIYLARGNA